MAKELTIKGKICRNYIAGGLWISKDGKLVATQSGQYVRPVVVDYDCNGKYVNTWKGRVNVAEAVLTCFCPPKPKDGRDYMVGYKDGNKDNCDKSNLEWVPYVSQPMTMADRFAVIRNGKSFTVCKNGTIMNGNQPEYVNDCLGDSDTDTLFVIQDPTVHGNGGGVKVDDLMAAAGYVHGDKKRLKCPVILHRDNGWKNFASDNLEWVEMDDQRYLDYLQQKKSDRQARWQELNPGLDINNAPYKI